MTIYLDRLERLMLIHLSKFPISCGELSGMFKPEWDVAFNGLHSKGLTTTIDGPNGPVAHAISDLGRAALLGAHGPSFFDMCYRADESEDFTW